MGVLVLLLGPRALELTFCTTVYLYSHRSSPGLLTGWCLLPLCPSESRVHGPPSLCPSANRLARPRG